MYPAPHLKRFIARLLAPGVLVATAVAHGAGTNTSNLPIPPPAKILETLQKEHPRLLLSSNGFERLKQQVQSDELSRKCHAHLQSVAKSILAAPPSKYEIPDGLRLLDTSRRILDRVQTLALLYRLDGDRRYADRAWQELDAAAHFKDWNPRHFLDTAEMTHAFAIGYDWLYDYWTPEQREVLRTAIIEKGIKPALEVENKKVWWATTPYNWNQVCNGGIGMGALAVADEEPDIAADFLAKALHSIQLAMAEYGPDGAWPEGPGYWNYATSYNVVFLAALKTALGTDFDLTKIKGFSEAGTFPIFDSGPTGLSFNYADAHAEIVRSPALFWLAQQFQRPEYAAYQARASGGAPLDLVWFDAHLAGEPSLSPPLDKYFRHSEVATLRSSWNDTNALFVGLKAGSNQANHSHLDLGSFVLDAGGERWAVDLGSDNYNLPGYFDVNAKRWTYYRLRAEGHNTLVINPTNGPDQNIRATARITKFESNPGKAFAITDLTAAYSAWAKKVERGMAMLDRRAVLVQDEVTSTQPVEAWWFFHTPADIEVSTNGSFAMLTIHGRRLAATIVSPAGARFETLPAAPLSSSPHPAGQAANKGVNVLGIHLKDQTSFCLAVELMPLPGEDAPLSTHPEIRPLDAW
jgi:Heparinase II/III-like protein/Domain of unknown function (DUF4962)